MRGNSSKKQQIVAPRLTQAMCVALKLLCSANETAADLKRDKWDFACEIQELRDAGVLSRDLRSLICQGLVDHALEKTNVRASQRTFRSAAGLRLFPTSCFVLSEQGRAVVKQLSPATPHEAKGKPKWDSARRELRLDSIVLKRFRQPAKNQEAILAAFEEEGWPLRIDDPLSGNGREQDAQGRLHETIKKLNRQTNKLIRFLSDGSGQGILWELRAPTEP